MGSSSERETRFEEKHLYLQWLYARKAWPSGSNRYVIWALWALCILAYLFLLPRWTALGLDRALVGIGLFWIIGLITMTDFLYFAPRTIHKDAITGMLDTLFSTPILTRDILPDIRRFIVVLNLKKLLPLVLLLAALYGPLLIRTGSVYVKDTFIVWFGPPLVYLAFWWFVLETGLTAAALPKRATDTGAHFLLLVVPLLSLSMFLRVYAFRALWSLCFPGKDPWIMTEIGRGMSRFEPTEYFWMYQVWSLCLGVLLFSIPAVILHFVSPRLMKLRRSGRWS